MQRQVALGFSNHGKVLNNCLQRCRHWFLACVFTLNATIATKFVCFSRLLKCLRSLYDKQQDPDQTATIGAVWSGSTLFASIFNSSVM